MPAMMALINCCHKVAGAARSYALNLMALGKGGVGPLQHMPKGEGTLLPLYRSSGELCVKAA